MTSLINRHCVPCEGGTLPLTPEQIKKQMEELSPMWEVKAGTAIHRTFTFENFMQAVEFLNHVAQLAESEGHHPDLHLTNYKKLTIELSTHAIKGLSDNDFIMAAKINQLHET